MYTISDDGYVYALSGATGGLVWQYFTVYNGDPWGSVTVDPNNKLYFAVSTIV